MSSVEHIDFLLHVAGREQNALALLRHAMSHRKHGFEDGARGVVAYATHFAGRCHIHAEHWVGVLQTVERELACLDAHVVEVEEVVRWFFHFLTQHHAGSHLYKVEFKHLAHKWE